MKFFIKTYGCQMNVNDSERIRHILKKEGFVDVQDEDKADIIIINTCAVREKPQQKVFSYVGRVGKGKKVVIAGCVAQSEGLNLLKKDKKVNFVIGTHQYYKIDSIFENCLKENKNGIDVEFSREWKEIIPDINTRESKVYGYISIMEGCNNFCSYCIVPFTRGREKYRPFKDIITEAEYLSSNGYKEIILLGQNVNSWEDKKEGMKFVDLLSYIATNIDVKWVRFITSYPGYYDNELIEVMAKHRSIARHIHFPAQSGSTRILKRMNRIYTREQYLKMIFDFKKNLPDVKFSSDFIVGFPSENENDFNSTLSLIQEVEYESIFSFVYSPRKHTKALLLKDDLDMKVKKQRLYKLQEVQRDIQLINNEKLIGRVVEVLVVKRNPKKIDEVIARTESHRVVNFESDAKPGEFKKILIENVGPYSLRGKEI